VVDGQVAIRLWRPGVAVAPDRVFFGSLAEIVSAPSLDPLLAAGRPVWTELRARLVELVNAPAAPRGATLVPVAGAVLPFTVAGLRGFLFLETPRGKRRQDLPAARSGIAAQLDAHADRLSRPGPGPWSCRGPRSSGRTGSSAASTARFRAQPAAGHRGRGRVRLRWPGHRPGLQSAAADHVFGVVLANDWSAADNPGVESQPLGPFLGKSFATSISAWITPLDALAAARVHTPAHPVLDYLAEDQAWGLDLMLQIDWNGTIVSRPRFSDMYYSFAQQLAHMTVNGATVRPGGPFFASARFPARPATSSGVSWR